jgi:hypothetical protein
VYIEERTQEYLAELAKMIYRIIALQSLRLQKKIERLKKNKLRYELLEKREWITLLCFPLNKFNDFYLKSKGEVSRLRAHLYSALAVAGFISCVCRLLQFL